MNIRIEVSKAILCLEKGSTILYPTDTVWGLGCDATNSKAVAKVYSIKEREESKSLIILVDSFKMLSEYVESIPEKAKVALEKATRPTTIIYKNSLGVAKNCIALDGTIAIRIVQDDFCKQLIRKFGKPIVSTSANISGNPTPKSFSEIPATILDSVDYIVNLCQDKITNKSSTILRITDADEIAVIRE
jgi:L-threonylcarbamoyladenylate synthase